MKTAEQNKVGFTPGPWLVKRGQQGRLMILAHFDEHKPFNGEMIASMGTVAEPHQSANARLIAATPDLLEALRGMLDALQTGLLAYNTSPGEEAGRRVMAARAALEKAGCE